VLIAGEGSVGLVGSHTTGVKHQAIRLVGPCRLSEGNRACVVATNVARDLSAQIRDRGKDAAGESVPLDLQTRVRLGSARTNTQA
jgi:hypothetical protein